jgi:hypothetical protein
MKTRYLLFAASVGLTCGFLFKLLVPQNRANEGHPTKGRRLTLEIGPHQLADSTHSEAARQWELRLSPYLNAPVIRASADRAPGPRAEAETVLRLLRQAVTEDSIREGIAVLNADASVRYDDCIAAVFERWAREAPEAALAAAGELHQNRQRTALVWKVFQLSSGKPDILAKAIAQPSGISRSAALAALAETVPLERGVGMLREYIKDRKPDGRLKNARSFPDILFSQWSKIDREMPLRLALATEDPLWRTELLKSACGTLDILADQPSSERFLELLRDPRNAESLQDRISEIAFRNFKAGLPFLNELPETNIREVVRRVFRQSIGMVKVAPWRDHWELQLTALLAETQSRLGAEGTRAILSESTLSGGTQGLDDAARWLTSRQDIVGLEDLTRRAALAEPFTTARWLAAMRPSAERDHAVAIFAETHAAVDTESATVWADALTQKE